MRCKRSWTPRRINICGLPQNTTISVSALSANGRRRLILTEILPVIDNFERASQNKEAGYEDFQKGIDMTFQQLMEIMKKLGVEAFGKEGDPFDPNIHNAVMHVEDETLDENIVTDVFSKGYQLGDRVLRHAMVKVAN